MTQISGVVQRLSGASIRSSPRRPGSAGRRRRYYIDSISHAAFLMQLMQRRDFLKIAGLAAAGSRLVGQQQQSFLAPTGPVDVAKTDFTLQIAPITVELAPNRILSTIGYNGISPGPLLRMKEGVPVTVNVVNDTDVPEFVHFHGLLIPSEVDGSEEEGTQPVPPHGKNRYQFTPKPAGTRWYHTHTMSMDDLHRGSFTGMFGFLIVEGAANRSEERRV